MANRLKLYLIAMPEGGLHSTECDCMQAVWNATYIDEHKSFDG